MCWRRRCLIEQKARDMLRTTPALCCLRAFKAQVRSHQPASCCDLSRQAGTGPPRAVTELEATARHYPSPCPEDDVEKLAANTRFLVRVHPQLFKLRALEIAVVFSGAHNDPKPGGTGPTRTGRRTDPALQRKLDMAKTDKTDRWRSWSSTTCC